MTWKDNSRGAASRKLMKTTMFRQTVTTLIFLKGNIIWKTSSGILILSYSAFSSKQAAGSQKSGQRIGLANLLRSQNNIFDTDTGTFFGTKFFRYRFRDFFTTKFYQYRF